MELVNGHVGDFAVLFILVGYAVSLLRDWRPIRTLRQENADLRAALGDLQTKYDDLEKRYSLLEKSRDFQAAFEPIVHAIDQARADSSEEHERLLTALASVPEALASLEERSEQAWTEITRGLAANTAAAGALAAGINAGTVPRGGHT